MPGEMTMQESRPISERPEFVWMLDMLSTSVGEKQATYVSVPITTGPRMVAWYRDLATRGLPLPDPRRHDGHSERRQAVIEPNLEAARIFIADVRDRLGGPVIDPSVLHDIPGWRQEDYIALWEAVIDRFASRVVLADGWNYSFGCAHEFLYAVSRDLSTLDAQFQPLSRADGIAKIAMAARELADCGADISFLVTLLAEVGENSLTAPGLAVVPSFNGAEPPGRRADTIAVGEGSLHYKDQVLDWLAERGNVAQFVSFDPSGVQRFCRLVGYARNHRFETMEAALHALFQVAGEKQINVRSFRPESPQGNPFRTRLTGVPSALAEIRSLTGQGLFCICNELVNERDGGVSGVAHGDWLEIAPDIFPRDVERKEVAALPRILGLRVLEHIYAHRPAIDYPRGQRVEFTVTVLRRGHRRDRTILWEVQDAIPPENSPALRWPNPLSRLIGDKAFGLTIAETLGVLVPSTIVIPRRLPAFTFGRTTGSQEYWLRTCPIEPVPGFFSTVRGWSDPFKLLEREDTEGTKLVSVLCQESVPACFSGKALTRQNGEALIEGVRGEGDAFMVGKRAPEDLPPPPLERVRQVQEQLVKSLGPVSFEWVDDGRRTWLVQLHVGASPSSETIIFEGPAVSYRRFHITDGLEALYKIVADAKKAREGIELVGKVGVTSHFGDLLRREQIPSRIVGNDRPKQSHPESSRWPLWSNAAVKFRAALRPFLDFIDSRRP
jgi:hypothetical protein